MGSTSKENLIIKCTARSTWMFFRNSLVSDLIFTGLFVVCMNAGRSMGRSRERASQFRPVAAG